MASDNSNSKLDLEIDKIIKTPSESFWKIRMFAMAIMLVLAIAGLLITYMTSVDSYVSWYAWLIIGVLYAMLSVGLAIYFKKDQDGSLISGVWREILHWLAFIVTLFILHVYVHTGMVGRFEGGLFILAVLSFSVLITGVYLDASFLLVGVVLAIFSLIMSMLTKYMALIVVFVVLIAAVTIAFFMFQRKSISSEESQLNMAQGTKSGAASSKTTASAADSDNSKKSTNKKSPFDQ
jgi:hypothetical protein